MALLWQLCVLNAIWLLLDILLRVALWRWAAPAQAALRMLEWLSRKTNSPRIYTKYKRLEHLIMGKLASREQILGVQDIGFEDIDMGDIPGWEGITVRVKDLSAGERDRLESSLVVERQVQGKRGKAITKRETNLENVRAVFCAACIVDENMQQIFFPDDIRALGRKSARALDRIFAIIRQRNGLSDEDVEELAGNFPNTQDGDSHTD
jgi:hypothetical protein